MSAKPFTSLQRAWYRWKALRLPWRKKFLVGLDLSGATFWEFSDTLSRSPTRMRRIVEYPRKHNMHYSDVTSKISPAWHQWLRHTRLDPPSLTEQSQDLIRQEQLKILAAQADARWEAKKRLSDMPGRETGQAIPALESKGGTSSLQGGLLGGEAVKRDDTGGSEIEDIIDGSETEESANERQTLGEKRDKFTMEERENHKGEDVERDPWKRARRGPGEEWQPQAWSPNAPASR